jgi:hypothetical protein
MSLIQVAKRILPPSVVNGVRNSLPRSMTLGPAITQVFIFNHQMQSRYTLTNFPSFFSPKHAASYVYKVSILNQNGNIVGTKKIDIPQFGTIEMIPQKIFDFKLPEFGTISVSIEPVKRFTFSDRHLGIIFARFYALYHDQNMNSMVLIHPQTFETDLPQPNRCWKSNLLIDPKTVDQIEIYQINPSEKKAHTDLILFDQDHHQIRISQAQMAPHSIRKIVWDIAELRKYQFLYLGSNGLTGTNAKPLVFNRFGKGIFSGSHS